MKNKLLIIFLSLFSFSVFSQATLNQNESEVYGPSTEALYTAAASSCNGDPEVISQTSENTCMALFSQFDLAQSFIANSDNVSGARLFFSTNNNNIPLPTVTDEIIISLFDNLPNNGGVMLASGSSFGDGSNFVDVCWPDAPVSIGTTYYLVFTNNGQDHCIAGDTNDPYPDGQVYANTGYKPFLLFDYTFEVFGNSAPIPTMSQWGIIILSVILLIFGVVTLKYSRRFRLQGI